MMPGRETWKEFYPPEWHDDQSMDVLFSQFRQNREINPHSWDKKLRFWTDMIEKEMIYTKKVGFDASQIATAFTRKGTTPKCLDVVLQEMIRSGKLTSRSQFESSVNQGWMSWGFDIMVKRPVSWSWSKMFGSNQKPTGEFVMQDIVKLKADEIFERYSADESPGSNLVETSELLQKCSDVCADMDTLQLVVMQLVREKRAVVAVTEKNQQVVSFVTGNKTDAAPVTELELKTMQLRKTEQYLLNQILQLSDDMTRCTNDARFYLRKGLKNSAKNALRRKQTLGRMVAKRETALETIHGMLQQILEAESHKKILDAYTAGASAFKDVAARHNLTTDNIVEVMSDVQEAFDMQAEINESMSVNPADSSMDVSTAELEEELRDLLEDTSSLPESSSSGARIRSPVAGGPFVASPKGDSGTLPRYKDSGLHARDQASPYARPAASPPRRQKPSTATHISPGRVPQTSFSSEGHDALNRTFPTEEPQSPGFFNNSASSAGDSCSFPSGSSESDLLDQLEALKVMEEFKLPEVPTFDPALPPNTGIRSTSSQKGSQVDKSRMRPLTS